MKGTIDSGVPPPPPSPTEASTRTVSAGDIAAMPLEALQDHLGAILRQGMPSRGLNDRAADGSPSVPSIVSVWLISQIGDAVAQPKLVNLAKVSDKTELTSLAGVARLTSRALDALRTVTAAS
jgi:hypothetical protein